MLYTLAVLGLGLAAGWWLRGDRAPEPEWALEQPAAAPEVQEPAPSGPAAPPSPWQPPAAEPEPDTPALPSPTARTTERREPEETTPPEPDAEQRFRALLSEQSFRAAMDLYRQVERRDGQMASRLRSLVVQQLEDYLRTRDDGALTGLVDAYLSVYYDDTEVLLILARYQLESDYPDEAARTFQLALSYSRANTQEQQSVRRAFHSFVQEVDQRLTDEHQWRPLIRFYETLQQLDLTRPEYQLRQAELYLERGESHYGYELLERLSANPAVAARVEALLQGTDPGTRATETAQRRTDSEALPLQSVGSHYHLPLRINNSLDVNLVIDTGASVTTLSRRSFEALRNATRFTELGPQVFNTAGGTSKGTMYRVDTMQLGRHQLSDMHVAVLDFNMPEGVDGLLGMNVLRHFRFQVDQDTEQLLLQPR